jgi:hypothetical protein
MGSSIAQVQSPQSSSSGKGGGDSFVRNQQTPNATMSGKSGSDNTALQGSQGSITFPGQGGQPEMGMPNAYSNTIGQGLGADKSSWDNSNNQIAGGSGKGKGV